MVKLSKMDIDKNLRQHIINKDYLCNWYTGSDIYEKVKTISKGRQSCSYKYVEWVCLVKILRNMNWIWD